MPFTDKMKAHVIESLKDSGREWYGGFNRRADYLANSIMHPQKAIAGEYEGDLKRGDFPGPESGSMDDLVNFGSNFVMPMTFGARGIPQEKQLMAEAMEAAGKSGKEIWEKVGLVKWPFSKAKKYSGATEDFPDRWLREYEPVIPRPGDLGNQVYREGPYTSMADVPQDLLEAYPELRRLMVSTSDTRSGSYNTYGSVINTPEVSLHPGRGLDVINHETNHAMQEFDNMPKGGGPGLFPNYKELEELKDVRLRRYIEDNYEYGPGYGYTKKEIDEANNILQRLRIRNMGFHSGKPTQMDMYHYLSGEDMSFRSGERAKMTTAERRASYPLEMDLPYLTNDPTKRMNMSHAEHGGYVDPIVEELIKPPGPERLQKKPELSVLEKFKAKLK